MEATPRPRVASCAGISAALPRACIQLPPVFNFAEPLTRGGGAGRVHVGVSPGAARLRSRAVAWRAVAWRGPSRAVQGANQPDQVGCTAAGRPSGGGVVVPSWFGFPGRAKSSGAFLGFRSRARVRRAGWEAGTRTPREPDKVARRNGRGGRRSRPGLDRGRPVRDPARVASASQ